MLPRVVIVFLVGVMTAMSVSAAAAGGSSDKLRICVADFRPEKGTTLTDREFDYCKMLQRAVEDELIQWYEVEESTRYGSIAKQLANVDTDQAARTLGEKAGVHEVVTGTVTKAGSVVLVQCHFVSVPRADQSDQEASNKILKTASAKLELAREEDWLQLMEILQSKIRTAVSGNKSTLAVGPPGNKSTPSVDLPGGQSRVLICTASGLRAGPNCAETTTVELKPGDIPAQCTACQNSSPRMTPDETRLRIAQSLRAVDGGKFGDAAELLDSVLKAEKTNGEAWHVMGVVRFFQGKYRDAEKCLLNSINSDYDRASVRDDLANTYFRLASTERKNASRYYGEALQQAYKSLALAPGNPWAHHMIGCATFMTAGKDEAKLKVAANALMKAAELLTSDPQLLDSAANALAQMKELDKAEQYARASLAAAEKSGEAYPDAYETLSKICSVKGDKDGAKRYHEMYRMAAPKN